MSLFYWNRNCSGTHGARATSVGRRGLSGSGSRWSSCGSASVAATVATAVATSFADSKIGRTSAEVAFNSKNLVVVVAEFHAKARPGVEVVGKSNGSRRALGAADRPELLECAGTLDRGRVVTLVGVDIVCVAVGGDGALLGCTRARVEGAEVLHNVVFDQRVPL